ncbi:MAG: hypothetical protein JST92_09080 [Deltaproteobacteria bacterium]|nr:hypothetical protein [Deltaproteobacteria bacterium]
MNVRVQPFALAMFVALVGACSGEVAGIPCSTDQNCRADSYCSVPSGETKGTCVVRAQECSGDTPDGCGATCTNLTHGHLDNCGGCGHVCAPATGGGTVVCERGTCTYTCPSGTQLVGSDCVAAPAGPTDFHISPGVNQLTLTWTASAGATNYDIFRGTSSTVSTSGAPLGSTTSTQYVDTGGQLTPGVIYSYEVRATNAAGSGLSALVSMELLPGTPTNLTATGSSTSVHVSWSAVPGARLYELFESQDGGSYASAGTSTATSIDIPVPPLGTAIALKVQASNTAGSGAASAPLTGTAPPTVIGDLSAQATGNKVTLGWGRAKAATSYKIYRKDSASNPSLTQVNTVTDPGGGGRITFDDTNLTPAGTTFTYRVYASNVSGDTACSADVSATIAPDVPAGLTVTAQGQQIHITWSAAAGASSYTVLKSIDGGSYQQVGNPSSTFLDLPTPDLGYTYSFEVVANNGAGSSNPSAAYVIQAPPAAIVDLQASALGNTVTLQWTHTRGSSSYVVLRKDDAGNSNFTQLGSPHADAAGLLTVTDSSLSPGGTTYTYRVQATNAAGHTDSSTDASATIAPDGVTNATATYDDASKGVKISWTLSKGASNYKVFRRTVGDPGQGTQLVSIDNPPGPTVSTSDANPTYGARYEYRVQCSNSAGTSGIVSAGSVQIPPGSLNPTGIGGAGTTANLSWGSSAGADHVRVYRKLPSDTSFTLIQTYDTTVHSLSDTLTNCGSGLSCNGQTIQYQLAGVANNVEGPATSLQVRLAPTAPVNGVFTSATATSVSLQWRAGNGATSYNLYRSDPNNGNATLIQSSIPATDPIAVTDNTVSSDTLYTYALVGVNGSGEGNQSSRIPAMAQLAKPQLLSTVTGQYSVSFSVTPPPGADQIILVRAADATNANGATIYCAVSTGGATGNSTTCSDTGLVPNTSYSYSMYSHNQTVGAAADSGTVSSLSGLTKLLAPTVTVLNPAVGAIGQASISWTYVPGATFYTVSQYFGDSGALDVIATVLDVGNTTYQQNFTAPPATTALYVVDAHSSVNTSAPFAPVTTVAVQNTSPPNVYDILAVGDSSLRAYLQHVPGYDSYDLFYSTSPGGSPTPKVSKQDTSLDDVMVAVTGLTSNTTYFVRVRASNSATADTLPWSSEMSVKTATGGSAPGPGSFVNITPTNGAIRLEVAGNPSANSMVLKRGSTPSAINIQVATLDALADAYTDFGASTTTANYYSLTTINSFGNSVTSTPIGYNVDSKAVTVTSIATYYNTPSNTVATSTAAEPWNDLAAFADGVPTYTQYQGSFTDDGMGVVTGTPSGPLWVRLNNRQYIYTTSHFIDAGSDRAGRQSNVDWGSTTNSNPCLASITGLPAWVPGTSLELFSSNANNWFFGLDGYAVAGAPAPGATSANLYFRCTDGGPRLDKNLGDNFTLTHLGFATTTKSHQYLVLDAVTQNVPGVTVLEGRQATFSLAMSPASTQGFTQRTIAPVVQWSTFAAMSGAQGASVTNNGGYFTLDLLPAYPNKNLGSGADMMYFSETVLPSTDTDYGTATFWDPAPGGWGIRSTAVASNTVPVALPGLAPVQVAASIAVTTPYASLPASPTIAAQISPVRSVTIGGKSMLTAQTNVGTTPTIQWTAPASSTAATNYVMNITPLIDLGNGTTGFNSSKQIRFRMKSIITSVHIPPGAIQTGNTYVAQITAFADSRDESAAPFRAATGTSSQATFVSAPFTP